MWKTWFWVLLSTGLVAGCGDIDSPANGSVASLIVEYGETGRTIQLSQIVPVDIDGEDWARLSDVANLAVTSPLSDLTADFEATDGFKPGIKTDCKTLIPLPGSTLMKGFVHLVSRNVRWEDALDHPGCLHPKNLAKLILADK